MSKSESRFDYPSFDDFVKSGEKVEEFLETKKELLGGGEDWFLGVLESVSGGDEVYPSQGLIYTGHEGIDSEKPCLERVEKETLELVAHGWLYYLELANHPERLQKLFEESGRPFEAPGSRFNPMMFFYQLVGRAVTIKDVKLTVGDANQERVSRTEVRRDAMVVSYFHPRKKSRWRRGDYSEGRKQARHLFVSGANPEITGNSLSIATLAQAHCLVCLPRDGVLSDIGRQADLAEEVFRLLDESPVLWGRPDEEKEKLLGFYKHNLVGVVESNPKKAGVRARALYESGVRTFRIYSPEPGSGALDTLKMMRKMEDELAWEPVEIFAGQVVSVRQAKRLESAGADALCLGIAGGGRCITGVVSDLTVDWPELVWKCRGRIKIPIIVEGGGNDHVSASLALGASGIGVTGKFGGSVETPGGASYFVDKVGELFKYYGGEASDRMRAMADRVGPLGRTLNREGETDRRMLRNQISETPTMLEVMAILEEGVATGMVFQNAKTIGEMQEKAAKRIKFESSNGASVREVH